MTGWKEFRKGGTPPGERKLKLLVVDDEARILESLEELFGERFTVLTALGSERGMSLFREHRPQIVLCDQRMPGRTGIEVLKEMKELEPGCIRMLITGYSDISVAIEAVNEQVLHRYVTKPWANEELVAIVVEGARRYLEENGMASDDERILF